ncbi:hypothetical protein KKB43_05175 [Patescibacteria group bacterium]|nr:hypothetical protein [Patescibacteria group bacterium]
MDTEQGKLWDIAEVFNAVIQNTKDFISLHGKIKNIGYPKHKELISRGSRLWKKNPDAHNWINEMLKYVMSVKYLPQKVKRDIIRVESREWRVESRE